MSRQKTKESSTPAPGMVKRIVWILFAGMMLMLIASLVSYSSADPPNHGTFPLNNQPANWCGWIGARIAFEAYHMLGPGAWVIVAGAVMYLATTGIGKRVDQIECRIAGVVLMALATSGFLALLFPLASNMPEGAGGLIAIAAVGRLYHSFNTIGTAFILLMVFGVGAMMAIDQIVLALPNALLKAAGYLGGLNWPKPVLVGVWGAMPRLFARKPIDNTPAEHPLLKATRKTAPPTASMQDDEANESASATATAVAELPEPPSVKSKSKRAKDEAKADDEAEAAAAKKSDAEDEKADDDAVAADTELEKKPLDAEALRARFKKLPITFAQNKPAPAPPAPKQDLTGYKFPPMELLIETESNFNDDMAKSVREQAEILEKSLNLYGIDAEVVAIDAGPVITLYEVQPAPGTKVAAISSVSSDIARELKAQNIRIVPNTAGKSTVGIEVPNLKKEKVRFKELMLLGGTEVFEKMRLPMFLGKDASGNPLIGDLASMPHMLIAGTTGSGKSVCINSIIMSFLYTKRPDELKLVLVDPKMVEMAQFRDIPHLMCPVVTEMNKAAAILEWAVTKMDERYELMAEAGVRDIDSYNGLTWEEMKERFNPVSEEEESKIPRKLPRLVFMIDELADLMMTNKEVEGFIVRIAQKARAVGIHLILATQRPQANVVTGLIKSNMPCRVAFQVASGMDSRIVLDQKGAELLLGKGDMLYLAPGTSKLTRSQGTLVDDKEVRAAVSFLKTVAQPSFEPQLVQLKAPGQVETDSTERDPMFEQAMDVVVESQRGSVSLLQRRLAIGYSRSSRLIEEMAIAGFLGEYKGSQAREVLLTKEEWEVLKVQMRESAVGNDNPKGTAGPQKELTYEEAAAELDEFDDNDVNG